MTDLTPRQLDTLARGLAAFDGAARARRSRRTAGRAVLLVAGLAFAVVATDRMVRRPVQGLPAYVEIIGDDLQLAAELEMANACERVARAEGRIRIVECIPAGRALPGGR